MQRGRLLLGTTVPQTAAAFLARQAEFLAAQGWEVHLVTSSGPELQSLTGLLGVQLHVVEMQRELSVRADVRALAAWIRLLRQVRPDAVMLGTPKAALLGLLAARLCGVSRRVYLVRGLRLEGLAGPARLTSWLAEKVSTACAQQVVCVSSSLRAQLVRRRLCADHKAVVLGSGSSNGVDTERFRPASPTQRTQSRTRWAIPENAVVVGFIGRLTDDKGVGALVDAVRLLRDDLVPIVLLVVGGLDTARPLAPPVQALLGQDWVIRVGHLSDPSPAYAAMDVLALLSAREGFPNTVLEAAAAGVPAVVLRVTGCSDAVVDGVTGIVVPPGSPTALVEALTSLTADAQRRATMGTAARARVLASFRDVDVWESVDSFLAGPPALATRLACDGTSSHQ